MSQRTNDDLPHEGVGCLEQATGDARSIILRRRARFLALALAAAQTGATACGGKTDQQDRPCLSVVIGGSVSGGNGAVGGYCLSPPLGGTAGSRVCLSGGIGPCLGASGEGAGAAAGYSGAQVCLSGGVGPCLSPPLPGGAGGQPEGGNSGQGPGGDGGSAGSETGGGGG